MEAEEAEEAEAGARTPEKVAEEMGEAGEARESERAPPCPSSSPRAFAPSTHWVLTQFCSFLTPSAAALRPRPVRVAL